MDNNNLETVPTGSAAPRSLDREGSGNDGLALIRSLNKGLIASLAGILVCMASVLVVVFLTASNLDDYAGEKSREKVARVLNLELRQLANLSVEYGWWNEAVDMLVYQRDRDWADANIGSYLEERYGLDAVLGLNVQGELVYGRYQGASLASPLPAGLIADGLADLIERAIDTDYADPQPVSGMLIMADVPTFVAATTFAVYEPTDRAIDQSHGALVLIKFIDEDLLASWAKDFQIRDLAFVPGNPSAEGVGSTSQALPLLAPRGEGLGFLVWTPEQPGRRFLAMVLPWTGGAALIMALAGLIFYTKLRRYSALAHRQFLELVANRRVLLRQAQFDFLTGLVNRPLFLELVAHETNRCFRHNEKAAVVYIDLDGFKAVNDSLGHDVGDELLCLVAQELKGSVRREDYVARFGGDEFCLLLTNITDAEDVERVLDDIHRRFAEPLQLGNRHIAIGASAGVVIIPDDTADRSSVFRYADMAMYAAKTQGHNGHRFYSEEMEAQARQRAILKTLLLSAQTRGELYLLYQPICDLATGTVAGVEALLRWRSPELGEVLPSEFITVAEESGAIDVIGMWVAEQVLKDLCQLERRAGRALTMSINVSARQLRDPGLPDRLDALLRQYGQEPSQLKLEITESLLIVESDNEHSVLKDLAARGYQLVLDDFGTGYSALGYLQKYPLHTIKIDKSFISGDSSLVSNTSLVKSIVFMANTMGMKTVAEGIESPDQETFVAALGCSYGQGFLYSPPAPLDQILNWITQPEASDSLP